jgi:hypothetical protein
MGWLKEILEENRRTVESWPEWKRRMGMDELDGMAAVVQGVRDQRFPHSVDAMVWADEYCKQFLDSDKMTMVSWFANSIMAGYDTAGMRCSGEIQKLQDENAQLKYRLRETAQLGIAEIGADGPENAESVVGRLVSRIHQLKAELAQCQQREARLRGLLDRALTVLSLDAQQYTILREDIAEELVRKEAS